MTVPSEHVFEIVIDSNREYFEEYLDLIKSKIDDRTKLLEEKTSRIKNPPNSLMDSDGYPYDRNEYLNDLAYEIGELEQLMYRSFVLSVFIFMEALISELCTHVEKRTNQVFGFKDLKGMGIGRSINYLKRVLRKPFPFNSVIRERFNIIWKIRNALIHNDGILNSEDRIFVDDFIKKNPDLLGVSKLGGMIYITHEYAKSLIELNDRFAEEISHHWIVDF